MAGLFGSGPTTSEQALGNVLTSGDLNDDRFGMAVVTGDFNGDHRTEMALGTTSEVTDGSVQIITRTPAGFHDSKPIVPTPRVCPGNSADTAISGWSWRLAASTGTVAMTWPSPIRTTAMTPVQWAPTSSRTCSVPTRLASRGAGWASSTSEALFSPSSGPLNDERSCRMSEQIGRSSWRQGMGWTGNPQLRKVAGTRMILRRIQTSRVPLL